VTACCDRLDPAAEAIGAVNTVYRSDDGALTGTNTDKDGVLAAIAGADIAGKTVCIIGSGGAARAAFAALAQQKVKTVIIISRNPEKAAAAASGFGFAVQGTAFADAGDVLSRCPLVINASPMGMAGQVGMDPGLLAALPRMRKGGIVFDMVYHPLETELLAAARRADLVPADGLTMLTAQAANAFVRFFGGLVPDASDPALRKLLTA
jgi:shikimate dehydrogenase